MATSKYLDTTGLSYLWDKIQIAIAKTTARADGKYLYNGQTVDAEIANVGFSNTNNLLNNGKNVAIRANSTNPFLGLKEGSNLWYAQAAGNYFYFGPTSTKALRLDQSGNGVFQTGSVTATSIIKSGGTSSQFLKADGSVDSNTYLTSITSITNAEIDTIWNSAMLGLIEFTVLWLIVDGGTTYHATNGMTWEEWINSEYNTDGYHIYGGHICIEGDWYVATQAGSPEYMVLPSDVIIANKEYTRWYDD